MKKESLILATFNEHKVLEMNHLLALAPFTIVGLSKLDSSELRKGSSSSFFSAKSLDKLEIGNSYRENAQLKAEAVFQSTKKPCLAEDSGLEIQALAGAPGVRSARYSGDSKSIAKKKLSDDQRCDLILKEMSQTLIDDNKNNNREGQRNARFVCVLAYRSQQSLVFFFGECLGKIGTKKKVGQDPNKRAFGYDPIFYPLGYRKSFAEFSLREKNEISHRYRACTALLDYWRGLLPQQ